MIHRVEQRLWAFGNCGACNKNGLVHPDNGNCTWCQQQESTQLATTDMARRGIILPYSDDVLKILDTSPAKEAGRSPADAGSGCQPTASAAEVASSRSGIPNAAFTPGPWEIYRASNGAVLGIGDAESGGVTDYQGGFWRSGKERLANINLVAAAPELYEALILASKMLITLGNVEPDVVSKALAKARGEQP